MRSSRDNLAELGKEIMEGIKLVKFNVFDVFIITLRSKQKRPGRKLKLLQRDLEVSWRRIFPRFQGGHSRAHLLMFKRKHWRCVLTFKYEDVCRLHNLHSSGVPAFNCRGIPNCNQPYSFHHKAKNDYLNSSLAEPCIHHISSTREFFMIRTTSCILLMCRPPCLIFLPKTSKLPSILPPWRVSQSWLKSGYIDQHFNTRSD